MNKEVCPVCDNSDKHQSFFPKEMMFGKRDVFEYLKCSNCGLLWIKDIPDNLSEYYPPDYFSFKKKHNYQLTRLRKLFDNKRVFSELNNGLFHKFSNLFIKRLDYLDWIKYANLNQDSRIVDVGCGSGKLLQKMRLGGFLQTEGLDPYIEKDIHYPDGLIIHKKTINELMESVPYKFDLVMLHHSYEHMPDTLQIMQQLSRMLSSHGVLLIRIPLCDSLAWDMYHEHWANLDAPRHLFLHTKKSLKIAAQKAGLKIEKIEYDSTVSTFITSELYKNNLAGPDSPKRKAEVIESLDVKRLNELSQTANKENKGDMAAIFLKLS